ncbi:MAG: alpha-mannosidase [Armatimonadota bacterium]|nr:MAG: alpha-mannosidase [Armatimonadota bacterium]
MPRKQAQRRATKGSAKERNPKDYTVHMIGNAHIDPIWLWRWQEGYDEIVSTSRSALDRMNEYPDFLFCRSSAGQHLPVEQDHPALFAEIEKRAREGRWHIVNGWWEQPDCNIPCGESFVRHALYAKRYFKQTFGAEVTAGYNVDTFGHCGTLPQILSKCGFTSYSFFRPGRHEKELPAGVFWWESPDGSRILACRPPVGYASGREDIEENITRAYEQIQEPLHHVMCFYGVGNHGGGPTIANIEAIHRVNARPDAPNVVCSTPDAFFVAIRKETDDFPVVRDELQHHAPGCYAAVSEVKRRNRHSEMLLMTAEKFAAVARRLCDLPYPQDDFARGWQRVLFNQFHDVLAGTSIKEAYEQDVYPWYDECDRLAGAALDKSLRAVSARIDTSGENPALVVFNPLSWTRGEVVTAKVPVARERGRSFPLRLLDHEGQEIPIQVGRILFEGARLYAEATFVAEVPALGYRIYRFERKPYAAADSKVTGGGCTIENEHYRLTVHPDTGGIASLYDKTNNVEAVTGGASPLVVIDDPSDTWSHGIDAFRDEIGRFHCGGRVEVIERGPIRSTIRMTSTWGASTVVQEFSLSRGARRIDWTLDIDWHEQLKALKLAVPVYVTESEATFEVPYGALVRPATGNEEPLQRWMDVTGDRGGKRYGVALLNDSKYGGDALGSEMRLTVLRSPVYAFHDPRIIEQGVTYDWTDQGKQTVRCALLPHQGGWQEACTVREGWALNVPLITRLEPAHDGDWPASQSFLAAEPGNVVLSVLKQAEDGDDFILRLYETDGRDGEVTIGLPTEGASCTFPLGRFEINTIRCSLCDGKLVAEEVDMLERKG